MLPESYNFFAQPSNQLNPSQSPQALAQAMQLPEYNNPVKSQSGSSQGGLNMGGFDPASLAKMMSGLSGGGTAGGGSIADLMGTGSGIMDGGEMGYLSDFPAMMSGGAGAPGDGGILSGLGSLFGLGGGATAGAADAGAAATGFSFADVLPYLALLAV